MIEKLELMRSWALSNGFYDWVETLNDVIDKLILLENNLRQTKDELEKLRIQHYK